MPTDDTTPSARRTRRAALLATAVVVMTTSCGSDTPHNTGAPPSSVGDSTTEPTSGTTTAPRTTAGVPPAHEPPPEQPATFAELSVTVTPSDDPNYPIRMAIVQKNTGTAEETHDSLTLLVEYWDSERWQLAAVLAFRDNTIGRACRPEEIQTCESLASAFHPVPPGGVGRVRQYDVFSLPPGWYRVRGRTFPEAIESTTPLSTAFELS